MTGQTGAIVEADAAAVVAGRRRGLPIQPCRVVGEVWSFGLGGLLLVHGLPLASALDQSVCHQFAVQLHWLPDSTFPQLQRHAP